MRIYPLTVFLGLLAACSESGTDSPGNGAAASAEATASSDEHAAGHALRCGCAIEEIGRCGEYIQVDADFVALTLPDDVGLGPMPFCGKDDLRAEVEGELAEQGYVATSFRYVE